MSQRPVLPYALGIAGLVPFVFFGWQAVVKSDPEAAIVSSFYLAGYGAVILSFLGGARWGAEIQRNPSNPDSMTLCLAMAPPLVGWAAIIPTMWDRWQVVLGLLSAGLALQLIWDVVAVRRSEFPAWYLPLRILLTTIAVLSLMAAAFL
ncbi:DUF3429 domain-containing protein [Hyphobacterium sp. HN65]|uniref:DUF3429 domain-containing protein n=1 Tax=Hyphobacterium lacteum TaxID=3116575 RepID=A0ABU7LNB2_9PROT|nr:DUF3429 domain-containing protein [Hyphobacterium sp. HN65]MEE2525410.1 DUF3429 domain-containing protein [Hyphobacterium sp. HN65]